MADETLVTEIDGPNGKAEIYEVPQQFAGGGQRFDAQRAGVVGGCLGNAKTRDQAVFLGGRQEDAVAAGAPA